MTTETDALPDAAQLPLDGEPVKRPRGRPRKDGLPAGSAPASKSRARSAPSLAKVREGIRTALTMLNGAFLQFAIIQPMDALQPGEIELLTEGLTAEVEGNKKLQDLFSKAATATTHGKLIIAVATIAYTRLVIHGVIPSPQMPQRQEAENPAAAWDS